MPTPYTALKPQEMNETFARAFNSGELKNLLALYERAGQHVRQDGAAASGSALQDDLQALLSLGGTMISTNVYCYVVNELALLRAVWQLTTTDTVGRPFEQTGHTVEVVRRQADGRWLYIIDHPFGAEPLVNGLRSVGS